MRLFLIFRNIKVEEVFIAMENTNELHNDNPLQSLTLCLDSAQIRQLLATIDFRENDVFRHTFGSEDELSRRIRIAYLSDLPVCPDFYDEYRACKKSSGRERDSI